jgi:hypothetical protein
LSPDERLETYVRQQDIVDIEINHAEFNDDNDVDDSDKDEGVEIGDGAFPELISEEDKMQLGNQYSDDGLEDTCMIDGDRDDDDGEEYSEEQPLVVDDADNINAVLVDDTPPVVVESPPVYCQITPTVHHQWLMSPQKNLRRSMSGNILHSQSKRTIPTAIRHS